MTDDVREIGGRPTHIYTCTRVVQRLETLLEEEECTTEVRALVQEQVEACPECFERLGVESELRILIKESCSPKATPRQLREKILAKLEMIRIEGC